MKKLFDGDDSDSDIDIKTDNAYAKNYNTWRQKEELNKLKTVYGENPLSNDEDSSSSSEDEDAKELTEEVEKDFFKTLACLKNKDPKIYDKDVNFFSENNKHKAEKKINKPEKPLTLRDHERKLLLEGNIENLDENSTRPSSPTIVEEQNQIRNTLLKIVHDDDSENEKEGDFGGIFKKRERTKEDKDKEEEEYHQWLAGRKKELDNKNEESELKPLKDYWNNPSLDANETFLRDYLLNKRFLDDEDANYIPSYEEIIHDSDENLSEDEKNIQQQEEFEHKYNFRFEEPDQEFLKRYPRTMEHSVRRKDDKRKKKRAELKERKAEERARKDEELKQLKALKRKEIETKIQQLREITGNDQICFQDEDIEGDFDPDAHDARMQEIFNNDFYAVEEGDQKPVFPVDEELIGDDWDNWKGEEQETDYVPHCEDDDFIMDCDYDPMTKTSKNIDIPTMMIENSGPKRKRRKKTKFAEILSQKKPAFNPNDKTYEEYLDEYYKLDYEDIIGDMPCRFKYKKVIPNNFGLTVEEILAAKDKELNSWCSLKKAVQIRPDHVERYDQIAYERKGRNLALKKKTLKSLYEEQEPEIQNGDEVILNSSTSNKRKFDAEDGVDITNNDKQKNRSNNTSNNQNNKQHNQDEDEPKDKINNNSSLENLENTIKDKETNKKKKNKSINSSNSFTSKPIDNENKVKVMSDSVPTNENVEKQNKKIQKRKKKNKSSKIVNLENHTKQNEHAEESDISNTKKSKKNKRHKHKVTANGNKIMKHKNKSKTAKQQNEINLSESRLRAYGINPKKFKNKQKFKASVPGNGL